MIISRLLHQTAIALSFAFLPLAGAAPIANDDLYFPQEDVVFSEPVAGVLQNDDPNGAAGTLSAVKVTDTAHGALNLRSDGSFTYTPQSNYAGPDSFTYKVVEGQGPVTFTIDQPNSVLTVNAATSVSATGVDDSETTTVRAKGTVSALLTPTQAPFGNAQIQTLDMAVAQQATLTLCVVEDPIFGACLGTLTARIEPDGLRITMSELQAGPVVPVAPNGSFTQISNFVDATGTVFLSTGGLASGITIPPTADINSGNIAYNFTGANISQSGSTLILLVPIQIEQSFVEPDYTATITVTGTIRATAPVPAAGPESNVATVTLSVIPEDDAPVAVGDRYYTRQNHTLSIPATSAAAPAPVTETVIAANSTWKYSTGADLSTVWRNVDYPDAAWASGSGVLGYDTDAVRPVATTIPARANMGATASASNPQFPAAYFRREFMLAPTGVTTAATIEFQRDDACIIFLNGAEIYRDSTGTDYASGTAPMAATGEIAYTGYVASSFTDDATGAVYKSVTIPAGLFRDGKNVISAMVKQQSITSSDLRWDLKLTRTYQPLQSLISGGSTWKYSTGSNLGTAWRSPEFNDSAWQSAAGPLGYDSDLPASSTIPARGDMGTPASAANPNHPTAYFRREFTLTGALDTAQFKLEFQRDDACIIYVNGAQVYRDTEEYTAGGGFPFPESGEVDYSTYTGANIPELESMSYKSITPSRGVLREGRNVIAVEVHQASSTSSDLRFDLRALRTTGVGGLGNNDSDVDGPAFNIVLHSPPANGTVQINPNGSFTYTPAANFPASGASATDSFVYRHAPGGLNFITTQQVFPMGGNWKFLDTGVAAPQDAAAPITAADWRHYDFDDALWKEGAAELGYGDNQVTLVEDNATAGYNSADTDRYITTYFRRKFEFAGATDLLHALQVRVIRDDAVAIFLNGTRIVKDGLPNTWDHTTPALTGISGAAETTPLEVYDIPPGALRQGQNVLAVEIHQQAPDSSDISFNMELSVQTIVGARVEIVVLNDDVDGDNVSDTWERSFGLDATVADGQLDTDGDGQSNRAEFLSGTDPLLLSSVLRTTGLASVPGNELEITFESVPGKTYRLQHSDALDAWFDTGGAVPAHPTNPQTALRFARPPEAKKFYRLRGNDDWQ